MALVGSTGYVLMIGRLNIALVESLRTVGFNARAQKIAIPAALRMGPALVTSVKTSNIFTMALVFRKRLA